MHNGVVMRIGLRRDVCLVRLSIVHSMAFICIAVNTSVTVLTNKASELLIPNSESSLILT